MAGAASLGLVPRRAGNRPCVWLHAVSVGEVNLLQPLLAQLGASASDVGMRHLDDHAHRLGAGPQEICRLPGVLLPARFHLGRAARDAAHAAQLARAGRTRIVAQLILAAREHGARVAVVNGRLSDKSYRGYRRIRPLVRRSLERIDLIAVQDETYAERFRALGARPDAYT